MGKDFAAMLGKGGGVLHSSLAPPPTSWVWRTPPPHPHWRGEGADGEYNPPLPKPGRRVSFWGVESGWGGEPLGYPHPHPQFLRGGERGTSSLSLYPSPQSYNLGSYLQTVHLIREGEEKIGEGGWKGWVGEWVGLKGGVQAAPPFFVPHDYIPPSAGTPLPSLSPAPSSPTCNQARAFPASLWKPRGCDPTLARQAAPKLRIGRFFLLFQEQQQLLAKPKSAEPPAFLPFPSRLAPAWPSLPHAKGREGRRRRRNCEAAAGEGRMLAAKAAPAVSLGAWRSTEDPPGGARGLAFSRKARREL